MTEKMQETKISIIIPVYNAEKYLEQCLTSVINQTYTNIEVLCVNDGSKDGSLQILQDFAKQDSRIKVFDQENSGPAKARNVGLENATGEYLMFCDADDWYEPTMCEEMYTAIVDNDVDFAMCSCHLVIADQGHNRSHSGIEYHYLKQFGKICFSTIKKESISVLLWNKIFKMELVNKYQITFPVNYEFDDDAFILQYLTLSQSTFGVDKKLYNYRLLGNSIMGRLYSTQNPSKAFDVIYIWRHVLEFVFKNNLMHSLFWLTRSFNSKSKWIISLLSCDYQINYLQSLNEVVLSKLDIEYLREYPLLYFSKLKQYSKALECITVNIGKNTYDMHMIKEALQERKIKRKYYRYKILSNITFGKMRAKYKEKRMACKQRLSKIESFLRSNKC